MTQHSEPMIEIWSMEAEQSVIGGLLADNRAYERVGSLLTPDAFYAQRYGWVYSAIASLIVANKPADSITVLEVLRDRGQAGGDGISLEELNALATVVPSAANAQHYAEIVAEKAVRRRLLATVDEAKTAAVGPGTAAEIIDRIAASFVALEHSQQRQAPRAASELIAAALARYQALSEGTAEAAIPTGLRRLDRLLNGGLRPGKVYCIGARPSVGKSSAARAILLNVAQASIPTLLLSQEMPCDEITDALVAQAGRIDSSKLQTGQLDDDEWRRLVDANGALSSIPLHVDDEGGLTLAQIRSKARSIKGLKVLALDYLQLCTSTLKNKNTNDEVAEISKGLKALALELGISVVLLSQLNREVERRGDPEPKLSDLRDSGNIEQDIDVAALLWTVEDGSESRLVGWKIAKHRGGSKGAFAMRWNPSINEWRDSDEPLKAAAKSSIRNHVD